jgi:hypothetical protein
LFVRDDADGYTNNNSAWSGYLDTLLVSGVPDLEIDADAQPYALIPGQTLYVSASVFNTGTEGAGSTQLRYRLSTDATIDSSDTLLATVPFADGLPAGEIVFDERSVAAPGSDGSYWVGACIDPVPSETDLSDNCSAGTTIQVTVPNDQALGNGVPHHDELTADLRFGAWDFFHFDLAAGAHATVRFLQLPAGYPQDLDLYVRFGDRPTLSLWGCRPYQGGAVLERCDVVAPATGRMWVGVTNWDVGTVPYQLKASWATPLFADGFESGDITEWSAGSP